MAWAIAGVLTIAGALSYGELALVILGLLTLTNSRGLKYGRVLQNVFTTAKTGAH